MAIENKQAVKAAIARITAGKSCDKFITGETVRVTPVPNGIRVEVPWYDGADTVESYTATCRM